MREATKQPNISDLVVAMLGSGRSVRSFRHILRERQFRRYRENSLRTALSRLQSKGYVENARRGWSTTEKGRKYIKGKYLLSYIPSPFKKSGLASTILAFDIPEQDRRIRAWLRNQIKIFGYKMLQQSLWIGPGPLPSTFLKRLEDLGVRKNIKTFKIV